MFAFTKESIPAISLMGLQRPWSFNCNYPSQQKLKIPLLLEIILVGQQCENLIWQRA